MRSGLLKDKGAEAIRKVFSSIHPPATLTATLKLHYMVFSKDYIPCVKGDQMDILFPPNGVPSTSKDYDITLLFILLRNSCGLHPPASTNSWHKFPPPTDQPREENLVRINNIIFHQKQIDDVSFQFYWNISAALTRLGVSFDEIYPVRYLACAALTIFAVTIQTHILLVGNVFFKN